MMTSVDNQPDWNTGAPRDAFAAVIRAAEHAADGRADAAAVVMAEAPADPAWLRITAVRTLAGLLAGPYATASFDMLRDDVHAIVAETGAPDEQVRLSLTAIALAQAYERGAIGRCNELVGNSEFPDRDTAHAAAVLAGHVVAYLAGDQTAAVFAALRRRNGLADA